MIGYDSQLEGDLFVNSSKFNPSKTPNIRSRLEMTNISRIASMAALLALLLTGCDRNRDEIESQRAADQMRIVSTAVPAIPWLRLYSSDIVRVSDGTLYVANGDQLLEIALTGTVRKLQTPRTVRYLTRDGNQRVYGVVDAGIVEITKAGKVVMLAGTLTPDGQKWDDREKDIDGPVSVARFGSFDQIGADAVGNIYMADGKSLPNLFARKIGVNGQVTTLFRGMRVASSNNNHGWRNFAVDSKGNLYFGAIGSVIKIDTAQSVQTFAGDQSGLRRIDQVRVDGRDNVYVNDLGVIRKITQGGVVTTVLKDSCHAPDWVKARDWLKAHAAGCTAGLVDGSVEGQIPQINGFEVDDDGNIYFVDANANAVRKASPSGVLSTIIRGEFPLK